MNQPNSFYNSLQAKEILLDKAKSSNFCNIFFCWLFTFGTWTFLIIILYRVTHPQYEKHTIYIIIGIIIYFIYFIFEIYSTTLTKIISISNNDIYDKIKNIIQGKPIISLNCIYYHKEAKRDVVTFKDSCKFSYYSSRDCSGHLILKTFSRTIKYKLLLKLNINKKIFFADNDTISDYSNEMNNLIRKNKYKDALFKSKVIVDFEGDDIYNIIKLRNKTSYFINVCLYIIFTFLTLIEFYKLFVKIVTLTEELTIVKFISTRNDLSNIQRYSPFNPELFLPCENKHIYYEPSIYNYRKIELHQVSEIQLVINNVEHNEINNNSSNNNNFNNEHNDNNENSNNNIINNNNNLNAFENIRIQNNQANLSIIH